MRLLTSKIHKAFPELDRFEEERCERFVRAARRGFRRSLWRMTLMAVAFCVVAGLLALAAWKPVQMLEKHAITRGAGSVVPATAVLGMATGVFLGGALAALLVRDIVLRRRVRYVIRARGSCSGCGYSLLGVPVPENLCVVCPECGFISEVDAALDELVSDGPSQRVFSPKPEKLSLWGRVLTPRRVARLKRAAGWTLMVLVIVAPAGWGLYEWFLSVQAGRAKAALTQGQALNDLAEQAQPSRDGDDAWVEFHKVQALITAADDRDWRGSPPQTSHGDPAFADFSQVADPPRNDIERQPRQIESDELNTKLGRQMIDAYRKDGVYEAMDRMAKCPRARRDYTVTPGTPTMNLLLPHLGPARNMARLNGARMRLAFEAGDVAEFERAARANQALARMLSYSPVLIEGLVGFAIESLNYGQMRRVLAKNPGPEWLDAMSRVLSEQQPAGDALVMLRGERSIAVESTALLFSEPANVRFGRFSKGVASTVGMLGGGMSPRWRLGTFDQNREYIDSVFDRVDKAAALRAGERGDLAVIDPEAETSLLLPQMLVPAMRRALTSCDMVQTDRAGILAMIALERFRIETGGYPQTLQQLVPKYLAEPPQDVWTGEPLRYRALVEPYSPGGFRYVLYSVGADQTDDGAPLKPGATSIRDWDAMRRSSRTSIDFVVSSTD
ncbi:MAG: hypothetical protein IT433_08345 [Phycisphaerales bacterium]|nr:hypothetical protein [Phycisphaerales bacterium]